MSAFWLTVLIALFITLLVLYGGMAVAWFTHESIFRSWSIRRVAFVQVITVIGTAFSAALIVNEVLAAIAVLMLTLLFDLALAGGRGVTGVVRVFSNWQRWRDPPDGPDTT